MADIALAATVQAGDVPYGRVAVGVHGAARMTLGPLPDGWGYGTPTTIPVRFVTDYSFPYSWKYQLRAVTNLETGAYTNITGVSYGTTDLDIVYTLTVSHLMLYVQPYYGYYSSTYATSWVAGNGCELLLPSGVNPRIRMGKVMPLEGAAPGEADVRLFSQLGQLVWPGPAEQSPGPGEAMVTTLRPGQVQEFRSPGPEISVRTVQMGDDGFPAKSSRGVLLHSTVDGVPANG